MSCPHGFENVDYCTDCNASSTVDELRKHNQDLRFRILNICQAYGITVQEGTVMSKNALADRIIEAERATRNHPV